MELAVAIIIIGIVLYARNKHNWTNNPRLPGRHSAQPQVIDVGESDDPFLDALEQRHNHAAERAISHTQRGEAAAALRWYTEAATLADVLFEMTGDRLWKTSAANSRDLASQHARTSRKVATLPAPSPVQPSAARTRPEQRRILRPAATSKARPVPVSTAPAAQPGQDDEREQMIKKFEKQHRFDRTMAEHVVDTYLANRDKKA